jgi:hypothetical protein
MRYKLCLSVLSGIAVLCACGSIQPTPEELNDPSIALHVVVNSIPSGAAVYGVEGDNLGDSLGTTPWTGKYVRRNVGGETKIFGTAFDQTIGDKLDFQNLNMDLESPFFFQCWLIKDGYKAQRVIKSLRRSEDFNPWQFSTSDVFAPGQIEVVIELTPSENE